MNETYSTTSSDNETFLDADDSSNSVTDDLPHSVTILSDSTTNSEVYLVGTAHFSRKSIEDVEKVMRNVKPHAVIVELCKSRNYIMQLDEDELKKKAEALDFNEMLRIVRINGMLSGMAIILFLKSSVDLVRKFNMAPGGEFRAAYREAQRLNECRVMLGDRPIQVTLSRAISTLSWFQFCKLFYHMCFVDESPSNEEMENCKNKDTLNQLIEEMSKDFPTLKKVFVDERDIFLTYSIQNMINLLDQMRSENGNEKLRIVVVIGMGHVPGIVKNWSTIQAPFISSIMLVPEKASRTRTFCRLALKTTAIIVCSYFLLKLLPTKLSPLAFIRFRKQF